MHSAAAHTREGPTDTRTRHPILHDGVRLSARDDALHVAAARPLNLERRALREEPRLIAQRAQTALHEIRSEVVEQEIPAQQEEGHDQQRRDEADEDVGKDQLASHPPQETPLREHGEPEEKVGRTRRDRQARDGVDDTKEHRHRPADAAGQGNPGLDRKAGDDRPTRQRMEQCALDAFVPIDRGRQCA